MIKTRDLILGTLSIILGVIGLTSPLMNVEVGSKIAGISTILLSIHLLRLSGKKWNSSKITGIQALIFGLTLIYSGYNRFTNINYYIYVIDIIYYLTAFLAIMMGLTTIIYAKSNKWRIIGFMGLILGIFYIIIGSLAKNPVYFGIIISIYLILFGLLKLFGFKFYKTTDLMNSMIKTILQKAKGRKRKKIIN